MHPVCVFDHFELRFVKGKRVAHFYEGLLGLCKKAFLV
jgi:hypothetical protein